MRGDLTHRSSEPIRCEELERGTYDGSRGDEGWKMLEERAVPAAHEASRAGAWAASPPVSATWRTRLSLVAALVLVLATAFWLWISVKAVATPLGGVDFPAYYAAARALRLDPHANIYDPAVLNASAAASHLAAPPPYLYTVFPALLLIPLTLLPVAIAVRLWLAFNAGLVVACVLLLGVELRHYLTPVFGARAHRDGRADPWRRVTDDPALVVGLAVAALLCFTSRPTTWALGLGQIDFLVLLPLALVPWLTRHGHERWVGACIAVAVMIKITPVVLLAYLVLRRRWEALVAALATLAVVSLACLAVVGPHLFFAFIGVLSSGGLGDAAAGINESLLGPLANLVIAAHPLLRGSVRLAEYAILGALAVAAGWVLWRAPRPQADRLGDEAVDSEMAAYALALCPIVLLSPVAWAHHYMWLLPAAVVMIGLCARGWWATRPRQRAPRAGMLATPATISLLLVAAAAVLLVLPLPFGWDTDPRLPTRFLLGVDLRLWLQQLRPLGGLALAGIAAIWLLRGAAQPAADAPER